MAKHRVPMAALTAIALLAGCPAPNTGKPDPGPGAGTKASPRPSAAVAASPAQAAREGVTIAGLAIAPAGIVAAGAGNVIVNNGSSLIGADGGSIVAAGAGNVISPNGAAGPAKLAPGAVAFAPGRRHLLAVDQAPLAGAEVFLAGPDGQPLPDIPPVATDAQGRYRLPGAPATGTFTVQVRVKNKAGTPTTLMTLVRPTAAGATANVSVGTHCVAVAVLDGQGGNLGEFNPAKFQSAVETTDKELTPETWPDPADRQAILATMSRLEAKIDLLQSTMNEIRAELKRLNDQLAASPTPASAMPASAAPSAAASAAASADPNAVAPGTTMKSLALRARLDGPGDTNMRVVFVAGDSDGGPIVGDDDGDVGGGIQLHLDQATFPATYRVYAQKDENDLDPEVVRKPENLLGLLTATGLGAEQARFVRRDGAAIALAGARLAPYFEPHGKVTPFTGVFQWDPDDAAKPAPAGPFHLQMKDDDGDNWSAANPFLFDADPALGATFMVQPMVNEIPARFLVEVSYPEAGATTKKPMGYLRIYRDYVTDEVRVRFDRQDGGDFDFKKP